MNKEYHTSRVAEAIGDLNLALKAAFKDQVHVKLKIVKPIGFWKVPRINFEVK